MPSEYPHIHDALTGPVLKILRSYWISLAISHNNTGSYIGGLETDKSVLYPYQGDDLAIALVNVSPHAAVVEFGHAGFHLPDHIRNWKHRNKKGRGYIRIPFRHFTPGNPAPSNMAARQMMPHEVYEAARRLGRGERLKNLGDLYKQSKSYVYYKAKEPNFPAGLLRRAQSQEGQPGYTWRASQYEGMVRQKQRGLFVTQATYSTFRTLSQDSVGWYIPAMPGQHYTQRVVDAKKGEITDILERAAARDTADKVSIVFAGAGFEVA